MASAVLASQNESSWVHMGKIPYSNPHLNSNPNPNPKKKQKQFHHHAAGDANGGMPVSRYQNSNNFESPAVTQTASNDAYSFNQTSVSRTAPAGNYGEYLTFNIASYSKTELLELRKRLSGELDQVRVLRDRIDSGQSSIVGNSRSQPKMKKLPGINKRPGGAVSGSLPRSGSVHGVDFGAMLKECGKILTKLTKLKCSYVFRKPVDAAALGLHDYHMIVKRPMDLGTVKSNLSKNLYPTPEEFAADMRLIFNNALLYNPKHDPVNGMAEQMLSQFEGLFRPIQEKLDIISKQRKEMEYKEFRVEHDDEMQFGAGEELQGSSWSNHHGSQIHSSPLKSKKTKPRVSPVPIQHVPKKQERMPVQAHSSASTPSHPPPQQIIHQQPLAQEHLQPSPVRAPPQPVKEQKIVGRPGGSVKLPKPRAKDLNKREMNMEEKQKLGMGLQSLPQEKMPQLVQIIKKRNDHLAQDGDEIELDIEALDTETLWELDRFVTNWKKMVSKSKRQALMPGNLAGVAAPPSTPTMDADTGAMCGQNEESVKKLRDNDEEDVDIDDDDDTPAIDFPPVEIEKDEIGGGVGGSRVGVSQENDHNNEEQRGGGGNASSSSSSSGSSSSDSSSSNDSDSGSSSGSDSDADDAQS